MTKNGVPPVHRSAPCPTCGCPRGQLNGDFLRWDRKQRGLTLREVARRAGLSAAFVCDVELNRRNCPPKLARFYRIPKEARHA